MCAQCSYKPDTWKGKGWNMQKYCTLMVKWNILKFCRILIKSFVLLVLNFSQISSLMTVSKSHVPFSEILAFTQFCKYYYYYIIPAFWNRTEMHLFLDQNWRKGAAKPLMHRITVLLQHLALLIGVEAWHPSLHPHFPAGNSTPVKWGRVINLISTATACPSIENKLLVYWVRSNFMGIQEWLNDFIFIFPILLHVSVYLLCNVIYKT